MKELSHYYCVEVMNQGGSRPWYLYSSEDKAKCRKALRRHMRLQPKDFRIFRLCKIAKYQIKQVVRDKARRKDT